MNLGQKLIPITCFLLLLFLTDSSVWAQNTPTNPSQSPQVEQVTLQLSYIHQFQFAGYYAAIEKGFYKEEGLEVLLKEGNPNQSPTEAVLADQANFGTTVSEVLLERMQGKPLVVLGVIFQHSPYCLISRQDSGIIDPHDLIGRRVMLRMDNQDAEFLAMFRREGISTDQMTVLKNSWDANDLIQRKVDAMGASISNGPDGLRLRGIPVHVIQPINYGIDFYGDCLFTTEKEIAEHPERVEAFRRASLRGWTYALEHPDEIIGLILQKYGAQQRGLTNEQLRLEATAMRRLILPDLVEIGHMNPERWNHIAETYLQLGMARGPYSLNGFIYEPKTKPNYAWVRWVALIVIISAFVIGLILLYNTHLRHLVKERTRELEARNTRLVQEMAERKQAEDALRKESTIVQLLHSITVAANEALSVNDALQVCLDRVCAHTHWPVGHAYLLDENSLDELVSAKLWHLETSQQFETFQKITEMSRIPAGVGLPGWILANGKPAWITDTAQDPNYPRVKLAQEIGIQTTFGFPVLIGKEVVAVLEFFSLEKAEPNISLIDVLTHIGTQLGRVIERHRAAVARLKFEHEREELLERLQLQLEQMPIACALTDADFNFTYWNPAAEKVFGYHRKEVIGKHPNDVVIPPSAQTVTADVFQRLAVGDLTVDSINENIRKDGSLIICEWHNTSLCKADGTFIGMMSMAQDITERIQAEKALKESEERYRAFIEQSSEGIWRLEFDQPMPLELPVDKQIEWFFSFGYLAECNDEFTRMYGFSHAQEMIGKRFGELIIESDPNNITMLRDFISAKYRLTDQESHEVDKEGHPKYFLNNSVGILENHCLTRIWGTQRDITERKQAEAALSAEKERLIVTLRSIGDGVITTDTEGKITLINKIAEDLTGWSYWEVQGRPLTDVFQIIHEKTRMPIENPVEQVLKSGRVVELANHTILIARDKTERIIADSGAPIYHQDGQIIGVVLVFRDITEKLKLMNERLKASKLESIGLLAGGIAHDFNNILMAISGNISLAKKYTEPTHQIYRWLGEAEKAAKRARELTQQILTFAKGGAPIRKTSLLPELIQESALFALHGSNVECQFSVPPDLWAVEADSGQLSQVIQNLVLNSRQAMPDGGVVQIQAENFSLDGSKPVTLPSGQYVKISVCDHGIGIEPENLPNIFDPYFTTKPYGAGLGLAAAYSIVQKHDGILLVESEVGIGTTFMMYLPASPYPQPFPPNSSQKSWLGKGRVLLMDDEIPIQQLTQTLLEELGYEVEIAQDGAEAIQRYSHAKATGNPFSLVILDLTVPGGMGGKETMQKLRELNPEVKAIVSSGYSNDPVMANYREYGFCGVVSKPFTIDELERLLNEVTQQTQLRVES